MTSPIISRDDEETLKENEQIGETDDEGQAQVFEEGITKWDATAPKSGSVDERLDEGWQQNEDDSRADVILKDSSTDASAKNARKNARTNAAEKRRAEVEARKLQRDHVSSTRLGFGFQLRALPDIDLTSRQILVFP